MTLSRAQLARKLKGGKRMEALTFPEYKEPSRKWNSYYEHHPVVPGFQLIAERLVERDIVTFGTKGTLSNLADYQYWRGTEKGYAFANNGGECRWCRDWAFSDADRKEHFAATGHAKLIVKVCEQLSANRLCVVCEKTSTRHKWGVPLHLECTKDFMWTWKAIDWMLWWTAKQNVIKTEGIVHEINFKGMDN